TTLVVTPPTSSVNPLPAVTPTSKFTVSWSGTPGTGAHGIASFDIFVSTDNGPFTPFLQATTQTSADFTGAFGHTYCFFSVATDDGGVREATPTSAQAVTRLVAPPTSSVSPLPAVTAKASFAVSWAGTPGVGATSIASYDVFVSTDNGPFAPF